MAAFPATEAEIVTLAQQMAEGLRVHAALFPAPPVPRNTLSITGIMCVAARNNAIRRQAEAAMAVAAKDEAFAALIDAMKADLRYAENTVHFDDDKLKRIGWGGHTVPTPLAAPGPPRSLQAPRQGEGWLRLDWKAPADDGAVTVYKLQRRQRPEGQWQDIGLAMETNTTLTGQERGKEWEYRVVAVNKAGESEASNTVMAVL